MSFQTLGLDPRLVDCVKQLGFISPTPIQEQAIPLLLQGDDVLACAQTGTGKTAAFGLPLIQKIMQQKQDTLEAKIEVETSTKTLLDTDKDHPVTPRKVNRSVSGLVLTPTRELAQQVFDSLVSYNQGLNIVVVYGGTSMSVQTKELAKGADIVVATPGRLLDHLFVGNIHLKDTQSLVLDEADRMLDMGFMPDLQRILRRMNSDRQTLFFSATFTKRIREVAYKMLKSPKEVQIAAQNSTAESVEQMVYPVDKSRKRELLAYLIGSRNWRQVLVFTKTKQTSDMLAKELKLDGINAASINGDKSQGARQKALDDFKSGKVRALIATDVAARGLDIQQLPQVVNYELPFQAEDYIHRIGRTGRAGETGQAFSLMCPQEQYLLDAIETLLDKRLPQQWLEGYEPSFSDPEEPQMKRGRSAEKRKLKAKLKIHSQRGKRR
ncbi:MULTISPECIES: DEAD/DEAH box helicase [Vibrio]|uniref:DEAD/DEAH box helicase n=1 Tax=Vibrio algicola TaxID=2662262 RepID=A0A5Q0TM18_9VIBR|nr:MULTISPECIES: DEAD/DEAH box helicase [Vibrio]MBD1576474.1 DEAD/DEAH box helicase [Vibrio sp. S11_S32]